MITRPVQTRPSSHQIGRDLEDQLERLLRSWDIQYRRAYPIVTSFDSRFSIDFWLPAVGERPSVVIEAKNFGVAAASTANSRGRKAQEALYLLSHIHRHCAETRGARIILVCGVEKFSGEQIKFLSAELGPDFYVVSVGEPERLRALVVPNTSAPLEEWVPASSADA